MLEGIEAAERGEFVDLTDEETRRYIDTGELPERVKRWLGEKGVLGCRSAKSAGPAS